MANQLQITQQLLPTGQWSLVASLVQGSDLPPAIFVYENTGKLELGKYIGVCNSDELARLQEFTGTAIKVFANKYVRSSTAKIVLDSADQIPNVTTHMSATIKSLVSQISAIGNSTQIINI